MYYQGDRLIYVLKFKKIFIIFCLYIMAFEKCEVKYKYI